MNPVELIKLNLLLEYALDVDGCLIPRGEANVGGVPRFLLASYEGGCLRYFCHSLPVGLRTRLRALPPDQVFKHPTRVGRILAEDRPCLEMWNGKGYIFERIATPNEFPDVLARENSFVIVVGGKPVSRAWTVRGDDRAEEVAVETTPEYRGHGYARQVTAAWAYQVLSAEKVAFYSHSRENLASRALARSLGLIQYATVIEFR
jgi:GNAT superfamily N-acetyltransferase